MEQIADVTLAQYLLVAVTAFCTSVIGGVAGYGTGLLLPPILVPIIGAEAVVPVIGLSAVMINASRFAAFRPRVDRRLAMLVTLCAIPGCLVGAYGYTRLAGPSVMLLIGSVMIAMVPLRRLLMAWRGHLNHRGLVVGAGAYGLLVGSTTGSGVMLLSLLLAAGLTGVGVVATDAAISIVAGIVKATVFQASGVLPASSWVMALLIGVSATPGAFVARHFLKDLTDRRHTDILDAVVILGGFLLLWQGLNAA